MYFEARSKAFTLIELLIVIIVIGILGGAMIMVAGRGSSKASATNIVSNLRSIKNASLLYYCDNGSYPPGIGFVSLDGLSDYINFSDIDRSKRENESGYYLYREKRSGGAEGDYIVRVFYKNTGGKGPLFDEDVVRSLASMGEKSGLYNKEPDPTVLTESNIGSDTDRYVSMFLTH